MRRPPKPGSPASSRPTRELRAASCVPVIIVRSIIAVGLFGGSLFSFVVDGDAEAPDTFSPASWMLILLPPLALVASLASGFWLRTAQPTRTQLYLSRISALIVSLGLVLACAFSVVWFLGDLFDYAIG